MMFLKPSSTFLKSSLEKLKPQKRSWMEFATFAPTFFWKIGKFGVSLCELFPDLRVRHLKIGQETSELGHGWTVLTVIQTNSEPNETWKIRVVNGFLLLYNLFTQRRASKAFYRSSKTTFWLTFTLLLETISGFTNNPSKDILALGFKVN